MNDAPLTVGSMFSGIGGMDLGLERAGMRVIWQCEIDRYASKVLQKHWPATTNYGDATKVNWRAVERPDVLAGGFMCTDLCVAGRRGWNGRPHAQRNHMEGACQSRCVTSTAIRSG